NLLTHRSLLEGNLVGVEGLFAFGPPRRRRVVSGGAALAVTPRVEHLEVTRADVEAEALLALTVRVRPRRETPLHVDEAPFRDHLLRALGERRPTADAVPVRLLLAVFGFPGDAVDGDAELAHRPAVWRHPELGVASDVADDDDLAY